MKVISNLHLINALTHLVNIFDKCKCKFIKLYIYQKIQKNKVFPFPHKI